PSAGVDQLGTASIRRWMEDEPLDLLRALVYDGLEEMLAAARSDGLKLGVFSDYPAEKKLRTMGLDKYFDVVVSAQDPEVRRFKPDALGLKTTLRRLGVAKEDAVYVGDRADVDGAAAAAAGMRCVILGDYEELMRSMCLPK
nr:HAD family hydrolase [Acidobacteriota bacterium]